MCYHFIREAVAADECRTGHIITHENPADVATKPLTNGDKSDKLVGKVRHFFTDKIECYKVQVKTILSRGQKNTDRWRSDWDTANIRSSDLYHQKLPL